MITSPMELRGITVHRNRMEDTKDVAVFILPRIAWGHLNRTEVNWPLCAQAFGLKGLLINVACLPANEIYSLT